MFHRNSFKPSSFNSYSWKLTPDSSGGFNSAWGQSWGGSWGQAWGSITTGTSTVYYWTGFTWQSITNSPKIFDGNTWVTVTGTLKTFDGTNWV